MMRSCRVVIVVVVLLLLFYVLLCNRNTTRKSRMSRSESTTNMTDLSTSNGITSTTKPWMSRSESTTNMTDMTSNGMTSTTKSTMSSSESTMDMTDLSTSNGITSTTKPWMSSSESTMNMTAQPTSNGITSTTKSTMSSSESTMNMTAQPTSNGITSATKPWMSSSESTMTMSDLPTSTSMISTTTTANSPDECQEWIWIGFLIVVIILVFAIIFILLLFCIFFRKRKNNENFSGVPFTRGLRNLGNTCYFNAAIQCLTSTPILKAQVYQTAGEKELTTAFLNFLEPIDPENCSVSIPLDPRPLLKAFCLKVNRFRGNQQHDSHELLRHFLDQLRQEERTSSTNVISTNKLTAVDKVFGGHSMTMYICKKCKTPYHICEPFLDISVPICLGDLSESERLEEGQTEEAETESASPYQVAAESIMERLSIRAVGLPAQIQSITDCLQYFTRLEMLGQQYLCNSCANDSSYTSPDLQGDNTLTPATKQTLIFNPPAVLVIHLKRFEMKSPRFEKRTNMITFEELLDLAPYCSSWCQRNELREQNIWYSLYAVVVHSGTLTSGHYVAYVKERNENKDIEKFIQKEYFDRNVTSDQLVEMMQNLNEKGRPTISTQGIASQGTWYCMNDSRVSRVSVEEVLRKEAFLLFYERVSAMGWLG